MASRTVNPLKKFEMMFSDSRMVAHIRRMMSCSPDKYGPEKLSGVETRGAIQVSTNGFAIFATKADKSYPNEFQGQNVFEISGKVILSQNQEPAIITAIRKILGGFAIPPKFTIVMNPEFLAGVLKNFSSENSGVTLRFWDEKSPVEIIGKEKSPFSDYGPENDAVAIIMPMQSEGTYSDEWFKNI